MQTIIILSSENTLFQISINTTWQTTLSEKIAYPTVYHHLSQLSVDIQLNGLIKFKEIFSCSNEAVPGDFMFTQLDTTESGALRQWTPVISS